MKIYFIEFYFPGSYVAYSIFLDKYTSVTKNISKKECCIKPILNVCQCNTEKYKFGDLVQRELASVVRKSPNLYFSVLHAANI